MDFLGSSAGGPSQHYPHAAYAGVTSPAASRDESRDHLKFDIFEWYPAYQGCQRHFLDHAQHNPATQAVAAFLNISLPNQRDPHPISSFASSLPPHLGPLPPGGSRQSCCVSLYPYIRRMVATGLDTPGVLHGFFGNDWQKGVGPLHEQERRNYLFAAKSGGWASVKRDYDLSPLETVPFLRPLNDPIDVEILAAERTWSEWLAMEDWMVGPRAPDRMDETSSGRGRPTR